MQCTEMPKNWLNNNFIKEEVLYGNDSKLYAFDPYDLPPEIESYFYKSKGP